ncbi:MAG: site-2 protease family protein [Atopobiaceae bacterium]|jgi:regulator of sigma E protease|nr:site-2 protease family protein [Atopobiaceae bacterium]MCH4213916.1 site-2 protease family protein [Atopobiaceae bacterium]MCI1227121.1 site-2 protease family protein [Atopobiaceae bacterium]MDD3177622.1 site-2 protease family protein [Atopobiaceae bacterium]MDD4380016.1 site-2 protease family protein [Atopobiaceae bacterium]
MSVVSAVFWGVIILSLLVFVHEGGHFLLARAFGVRVTEFFLGLPCRFKLSHRSRRYGTEVGVTPLLLGGYNRICGMEGDDDGTLAGVLACVQAHGRVSVDEVATECALDHDVALASLVTLSDWASVEAFYDPEKGERPTQRYYPECFQTVRRDGALLTAYDRDHDFEAPGVSDAGAPRPIEGEPEGFLSGERSHTYQGLGFWRRFCILVAGATVNVVCGFLLVVCVLMFAGVETTTGTNVISGVVEGSLAQDSGLAAGDSITSVAGTQTDDWEALVGALSDALGTGQDFAITYTHDGQDLTSTVPVDGRDTSQFGIYAEQGRTYLGFTDSCAYTASYIGVVASYVVKLMIPTHTAEVLQSSTSIVGISVMASQAAAAGADQLALFAAAISLSLGFMNLLPIPPLDGGKILIEAIQAIAHRKIPAKANLVINYIGLGLFMLLFVYMLRQDVFRFILG